jgi:transposase InsO family protein
MSRVLKVSRSGYYKWKNGSISHKEKRRQIVKAAVKEAYYQFKKRYGAPRLTLELNSMGISCSLNHVADLLRELGLKACNGKNFKYSSPDEVSGNVSKNLLERDFTAQRPNEKWSGDITYILANGKWMYLAVFMDLCTKAIVGWSLDTHMTESLVCDALEMALSRRNVPEGLIVHSDRGVQYRSHSYRQMLLDYGCQISMSRKGDCWDNAPVEAFFSRFKVECIYPSRYKSINEARADIFEYIEIFYNRKRRHSAIGNISPMQYEQLAFN